MFIYVYNACWRTLMDSSGWRCLPKSFFSNINVVLFFCCGCCLAFLFLLIPSHVLFYVLLVIALLCVTQCFRTNSALCQLLLCPCVIEMRKQVIRFRWSKCGVDIGAEYTRVFCQKQTRKGQILSNILWILKYIFLYILLIVKILTNDNRKMNDNSDSNCNCCMLHTVCWWTLLMLGLLIVPVGEPWWCCSLLSIFCSMGLSVSEQAFEWKT